jgi:hypothetical protein
LGVGPFGWQGAGLRVNFMYTVTEGVRPLSAGEFHLQTLSSYYRARCYDPQAGSFTAEDPLALDSLETTNEAQQTQRHKNPTVKFCKRITDNPKLTT